MDEVKSLVKNASTKPIGYPTMKLQNTGVDQSLKNVEPT